MNVFCATGNLGSNAEVRYLTDGNPVTNFSIAVKAGYGKNETTTWVRCSLFGKRGEAISEYLIKGTQIGISGEISLKEYGTKDGKKQSLECRVNDVTLLGKKVEAEQKKAGATIADMDDDPPF